MSGIIFKRVEAGEADYPAAADVIKGVEFDDGQETGTYVNSDQGLPSCGIQDGGGVTLYLGDAPQEDIRFDGDELANGINIVRFKNRNRVLSGCNFLNLVDNALAHVEEGGTVHYNGADEMLEGLAANDIDDGFCDLSGGTNTPPTSDGEAAITTLEGRDWSVYVNENGE